KYGHRDNIVFVLGDAENLKEYFMEKFDAIFYTASIFLIPNFRKSLREAFSLLNPGGKVAISFYSGLSDIEGSDVVKKHFPDFKYRYGAFSLSDLFSFLKGERVDHFTTDYIFPASREFIRDFLSIPAQASGLFPRQPYSRQKVLVEEFLDDLYSREDEIYMKWTFIIIST
ncbi:MAG: methyltransferase domain-containing protein, partial [Deltaproteobacteria bacterium]